MRRRSRNKSISLMTAVLVELGTMVGIIAVAQPTWTRGLAEQLEPPEQVTAEQAHVTPPPSLEFNLHAAPNVDRVSSLVLPPPMDARPITSWSSPR
jgi:hypothetical protein